MTRFREHAKEYLDAESMADDYLKDFYGDDSIPFPISPFQMLKQEGIPYFLRNFKKLEGIYIPAANEADSPTVAQC